MSIKDIFNNIVNYDLTQLGEYIISLIVIAILLIIVLVVFNIFHEFFTTNPIGIKIFKLIVKILWSLFFIFLLLGFISIFAGDYLINYFLK